MANTPITYKALAAISALLFLATIPMPYGFYTFLKIVVFLAAGYTAYQGYSIRQDGAWPWLWGVIAVIYNPVILIEMNKAAWVFANVLTGAIFAYTAFGVYLKNHLGITDATPRQVITEIYSLWRIKRTLRALKSPQMKQPSCNSTIMSPTPSASLHPLQAMSEQLTERLIASGFTVRTPPAVSAASDTKRLMTTFHSRLPGQHQSTPKDATADSTKNDEPTE